MPFIYKITNKENGKIYIGKTSTSLEERWKEHVKSSKRQDNQHRPICRAIAKYGEESFDMTLIESVENDTLASEREMFWISEYDSFGTDWGYNATAGGDGRSYIEVNDLAELFRSGKSFNEISRLTGHDPSHISSLQDGAGVYKKGTNPHASGLKIDKIDREGNVVETFASLKEAARAIGKKSADSHICNVCKGRRKTAFGYFWKYHEEDNK